jgi:AraC family ethanolamine operon transcriptional activator
MTIDDSAPMLAPQTFRFNDIDAFRSSIRSLNVSFTPLVRRIAAEQTILHLPGCDISFTKSFPRIIDAQLALDCTVVGFSMDNHEVPIRFNGERGWRAAIVVGGGGGCCCSVETVERQWASLVFRPEVEDRGWPDSYRRFAVFETSLSALQGLRRLVEEVLAASAGPVEPADAAMIAAAMRESLLAGADAAFANVVPSRVAARASDVRPFKVFQDIRAILSEDLSQPIYSQDMAKRLGVSVRSLHDTVQRYRGMSLHRYLRLQRLWLVRRRLLAGAESVKAAALAFGFWHLSDFSRSYRLQFGEMPSATLARGRGG